MKPHNSKRKEGYHLVGVADAAVPLVLKMKVDILSHLTERHPGNESSESASGLAHKLTPDKKVSGRSPINIRPDTRCRTSMYNMETGDSL